MIYSSSCADYDDRLRGGRSHRVHESLDLERFHGIYVSMSLWWFVNQRDRLTHPVAFSRSLVCLRFLIHNTPLRGVKLLVGRQMLLAAFGPCFH